MFDDLFRLFQRQTVLPGQLFRQAVIHKLSLPSLKVTVMVIQFVF